MSKPKKRGMAEIRSAVPAGDAEICMAGYGPEDRGELGRLRVRGPMGVRWVWQLRCPWCRDLIEIAAERVYMLRGKITIRGGPVRCNQCETGTDIAAGVGRRHRNGTG